MKGAAAPTEPSGNNSSPEVAGCAGFPRPQGCRLHVATCVGVRPTLPPRFPSRDSYHVPHDGWTPPRCSVGSPAHPATPAAPAVACQASLDVGFQDQRSTASAICAGVLAGGVDRGGLGKCTWDLRALSRSLEPPRPPRNVCRVCKVPAASPGPASPLPRKRGRGSSFHNKSPAWGSCSRLKQGPGARKELSCPPTALPSEG